MCSSDLGLNTSNTQTGEITHNLGRANIQRGFRRLLQWDYLEKCNDLWRFYTRLESALSLDLDLDVVFMFPQRRQTKCLGFFVLKCSPEADLKRQFFLFLHCWKSPVTLYVLDVPGWFVFFCLLTLVYRLVILLNPRMWSFCPSVFGLLCWSVSFAQTHSVDVLLIVKLIGWSRVRAFPIQSQSMVVFRDSFYRGRLQCDLRRKCVTLFATGLTPLPRGSLIGDLRLLPHPGWVSSSLDSDLQRQKQTSVSYRENNLLTTFEF